MLKGHNNKQKQQLARLKEKLSYVEGRLKLDRGKEMDAGENLKLITLCLITCISTYYFLHVNNGMLVIL